MALLQSDPEEISAGKLSSDLVSTLTGVTIQGVPYEINWRSEKEMSEPVGMEITDPDNTTLIPAAGSIDFNQQRIDLNRDLPDQSRRVVLMHEILHACLYQLNEDKNERLIHALAYVLVDTFQKNKHLVLGIIGQK